MAIVAVMFMTGCTDACKDVDCGTALQGTCVEGTCECLLGYEGDDCKTASQTKFLGTYLEAGTCSVTGPENSTVTITASSDMTKILISGFWGLTVSFSANLSADGLSFTIPSTNVSGTTVGDITVSGSGSRAATSTTITASFSVIYGTPSVTDNCNNITWTKQ